MSKPEYTVQPELNEEELNLIVHGLTEELGRLQEAQHEIFGLHIPGEAMSAARELTEKHVLSIVELIEKLRKEARQAYQEAKETDGDLS